jgi:hypothetical protein
LSPAVLRDGLQPAAPNSVGDRMKDKRRSKFVICIRNGESEDLELRKVYQVIPDRSPEREGLMRIVDESGEDYLYPSEYFAPVKLAAAVAQELASTTA